jgi:hypothetical protein
LLPTTQCSLKRAPSVTPLQGLKHLLLFADQRREVMLRFGLPDEIWEYNCMQVISVSNNSVAFQDKINGKVVVRSQNMIILFELDGSVLSFEPNAHYDLVAV